MHLKWTSISKLAFALALVFSPVALAAFEAPPAPQGYVLDEASVLSAEIESALEAQLMTLDEETTTQMVVVTLESLQGDSIESAGLEIGRSWGVGQEGLNNGLVFLVVPSAGEARIEVGFGLEGAITDAMSRIILEDMAFPDFRVDNYDAGTLKAMAELEALARGEEFSGRAAGVDGEEWASLLAQFGLFFLPFIWMFLSWLADTKAWWMGGIFGGLFAFLFSAFSFTWLGIGAALGLLLDFILSKFFYKQLGGGRSPYSGGFWGGGSSGGFGGFGGGSFGGGGASGRF